MSYLVARCVHNQCMNTQTLTNRMDTNTSERVFGTSTSSKGAIYITLELACQSHTQHTHALQRFRVLNFTNQQTYMLVQQHSCTQTHTHTHNTLSFCCTQNKQNIQNTTNTHKHTYTQKAHTHTHTHTKIQKHTHVQTHTHTTSKCWVELCWQWCSRGINVDKAIKPFVYLLLTLKHANLLLHIKIHWCWSMLSVLLIKPSIDITWQIWFCENWCDIFIVKLHNVQISVPVIYGTQLFVR